MSEKILCQVEDIFAAQDPCAFVQKFCEDPEKSSQYYYELYFCVFNQSNWAFILFTIVFLITAFYLLSSTAEIYLSPALSQISNKLNLSETLAGVTLVAFSNGAPDIISSFSAAESLEGIPLVIGSVFGGGLFITSVIVALVIFAAKYISADRPALLRDVIFYLIATLYVMMMGVIGYINLNLILGFMFLYPCYIVVVFIMERKNRSESLSAPFLDTTETSTNYNSLNDDHPKKSGIELSSKFLMETSSKALAFEAIESVEKENRGESPVKVSKTTKEASPQNLLIEMNKEERRRCWGCLNTIERCIKSLQAPFLLFRSLTIPAVDNELWNKYFALIQPFSSVYFFLFVTGSFFQTVGGYWIGLVLLPFQLLLVFIIWKYTSATEVPSIQSILIIGGLVLSMTWIYQIAVLTVEYLEFVGFITELHPTLLGMSLLAWGNSMQDMFGNRSLAKLGYGLMALTGCFAGSLFNLLIGFGSSMLRQVLNTPQRQVEFKVFDFSREGVAQGSLLSTGILLISFLHLLIALVYAALKKFQFKMGFAIYLMIIYGLIIAGATFYTFHLKYSLHH